MIGLEPRALPMLSKLSTMELHVPSLGETFKEDPLQSFLETYPFGCDPPKAEPPKRHKTHSYCVCVCFVSMLVNGFATGTTQALFSSHGIAVVFPR